MQGAWPDHIRQPVQVCISSGELLLGKHCMHAVEYKASEMNDKYFDISYLFLMLCNLFCQSHTTSHLLSVANMFDVDL